MQFVAEQGALATELDGSVVVLDVESGAYFNLPDVAAEIWRQLAEPRSLEVICAHLARCYEAPEDRIRTATIRFLEDLEQRKLIKRLP